MTEKKGFQADISDEESDDPTYVLDWWNERVVPGEFVRREHKKIKPKKVKG